MGWERSRVARVDLDGLGVGRRLGGLVEKEFVIIFVFLLGGGIGVTWVLFRVAGLMEGAEEACVSVPHQRPTRAEWTGIR